MNDTHTTNDDEFFYRTISALSEKISIDTHLVDCNRLIRCAAAQTRAAFNECLKQHGLTDTLWLALLFVYARPEHALLPSELGKLLGLTRANMTKLTDTLENNGWIRRQEHASDRRKTVLELTEIGVQKIHEVSPHTSALNARLWQNVSREEQATLCAILKKINHRG